VHAGAFKNRQSSIMNAADVMVSQWFVLPAFLPGGQSAQL
jgi:hypothetical protein